MVGPRRYAASLRSAIMNGEFTSYMIDELRTLVSQLESGREPYNKALYSVVKPQLRWQYETEKKLRNAAS